MSLQVWLPLNGDLHNQGLDNIIMTNNGATVNNNGKIGKCYYFNGNSYLQTSSLSGVQSICFWVKLEKKNTLQVVFVDYKSKLAFGFDADNQIIVSCANKRIEMYSDINFPNNVWTHIALVYNADNSDILLYINGILQTMRLATNYWVHKTDNLIIGARNNNSIASYINGYINDFRMYNHCLSAKEVEEISKGLVLHYKLDNIIDNNIYDSSGFGNNGIIAGDTFELSSDSAKYSHSISLPNNNWIRVINRPTIVCSHDAITVNIWAKIATSWSYNKGALISCQENGGFMLGKNSSGYLYFGIYADGAYRSAKATDNSHITAILNGWHMVTGTADSSTIKIYFDGELINSEENTATTGFSYANNYIFIGGEAKANNTTPYSAINGLFGDTRIYATALTPHQIKELYQTSTTIDKNGNIYAKEYIENNANININKNGQLQSNKIVDSNDIAIASFKKSDKSINGNTIYEY